MHAGLDPGPGDEGGEPRGNPSPARAQLQHRFRPQIEHYLGQGECICRFHSKGGAAHFHARPLASQFAGGITRLAAKFDLVQQPLGRFIRLELECFAQGGIRFFQAASPRQSPPAQEVTFRACIFF